MSLYVSDIFSRSSETLYKKQLKSSLYQPQLNSQHNHLWKKDSVLSFLKRMAQCGTYKCRQSFSS